MFEPRRDQIAVEFTTAHGGTEPLTWGQKAIWQDMQESGNQFTMFGGCALPEGSTAGDAAARLSGLRERHAALRMRLGAGAAGQPCQDVARSGQIGLDVLAFPDDADPAGILRYAEQLIATWPLERYDFHRDWPLRMAALTHRGACLYLVWTLSHLVADGGANLLVLDDLVTPGEPRGAEILDIARNEQTPQFRQLSSRAMRHWAAQLRHLPPQTFGEQAGQGQAGPQYRQARFVSPAAHLALLAVAKRTGTDASRVTLALIATAIGRAAGVNPLTIKVMANNRFRPGLASVIAPIAQNSAVTIDLAADSIDEVVARARGASMTASMRAYYDPDDLSEVMARLDAERGYPARVTCRVNDQRAMVMRDAGALGEVTPEQVRGKLAETSLTWLGPEENMHEQVIILIENQTDVLSLYMFWDLRCLTEGQAEALLRGVEEVAVEAAFDPAAPTRVPGPVSAR